MKGDSILNILTFDIEEWYHANLADIPEDQWGNCEQRLEPLLDEILGLLKYTNNKATFFTVASLATRFPDMINRIVAEGHELASHSYSHKMLTKQTEEEFERDVKLSQSSLSSVSGQEIVGYRAPSWSVTQDNKAFVMKILTKYGFLYDSSIFPFKTFLYGDDNAPHYPNVIHSGNGQNLYEIPPSILKLKHVRIPYSGGFYFRVLPYVLIKNSIKITNKKGRPAVIYIHPHDMDPGQPRIIKGLANRMIHYTNLRGCKVKFQKLLREFRFGRMDEYARGLMKER